MPWKIYEFLQKIYCKTIFFFSKRYNLSDNPLRFRNDLLEIIYELIMATDDKFRDEKLCKVDNYEYLTGDEILPKFICSPLGKVFEKETKTIDDQEKNLKEWRMNGKKNEEWIK